MVAIEGEMVGRKDFPIIFMEVSLNFRFGPEFLPLLYDPKTYHGADHQGLRVLTQHIA